MSKKEVLVQVKVRKKSLPPLLYSPSCPLSKLASPPNTCPSFITLNLGRLAGSIPPPGTHRKGTCWLGSLATPRPTFTPCPPPPQFLKAGGGMRGNPWVRDFAETAGICGEMRGNTEPRGFPQPRAPPTPLFLDTLYYLFHILICI